MIAMNRYITLLTLIASLCFGTACSASVVSNDCDGDCIYSAIRHDEVHKIREVLYDQASFDRLIPARNTDPLLYAARAEACAVGGYFIDKFYSGEEALEARNQAYMEAAASGSVCIIKVLLVAGVDLNYTISGMNALYYALSSEKIEAANLLLEAGIEVFVETDKNENMLFAAAWLGDVAIAKRLFALGVTPNMISDEGKSPADYAAHKWGENSAIYEFLIQAEREQRQKDKSLAN